MAAAVACKHTHTRVGVSVHVMCLILTSIKSHQFARQEVVTVNGVTKMLKKYTNK